MSDVTHFRTAPPTPMGLYIRPRLEPHVLPIEIVVAVLSLTVSLAVFRAALVDRGSFWAGPAFGFAVVTCVIAFATSASPAVLAISAVSVLAVVQAWALRIGAPRTLAHFAAAPRLSDGTPGWWSRFERDLQRYAAAQANA
jgi:hypothetical protein